MIEKVCTKCSQSKPLTEYHNAKNGKYGKDSQCKSCKRVYQQKNKERKRLYDKHYIEANKERIAKRFKEYYHKNKEARKAYIKKWQEANKELVNSYKKNNKYKRREIVNSSSLSSKDLREWVESQTKVCTYCHIPCEDSFQIDHIVPLCKEGTHTLDNLTISCPKCNREKSGRLLEDWLEEKELLEAKDKKP